MDHRRTTLLAGIAALAFAAGTGLASAQQASPEAPSKQPHAMQQMNRTPGSGNTGQSAQQQGGSAQQAGQRAEENSRAHRSERSATDQKGVEDRSNRRNTAQDRDRMKGRNTAESERNGMKGLQGNASGMSTRLTDEQRTRIRTTVINAAGAPRVGSVNFDVTVGTAIPRGRIHVVPVPETLVQIEPRWRGFLYFVHGNDVVIVNPRNMKIVAVVPA